MAGDGLNESLSACATPTMGGRMGEKQNKQTPICCMLKNFKKGYSGAYGVKFTPQKLYTFYEIDWPSFGVGWPAEWSLDKEVIVKVSQVITSQPGHQTNSLISIHGRQQFAPDSLG